MIVLRFDTPAQAIDGMEQAKAILLAVAASPATQCETIEWTEEQEREYAYLRDVFIAIMDDMKP